MGTARKGVRPPNFIVDGANMKPDVCEPFVKASISGAERELELFFNALLEAYTNATKRQGTVEHCFTIAGCSVRLFFAGPAMIPFITPSLNHLSSRQVSIPVLTVCLFDSASTGVELPTPPWSSEDYVFRGAVRGYDEGKIAVGFFPWSGIISILDVSRNLAIHWIQDARRCPSHETGSPLLMILHLWMEIQRRQLIHAGAVGTLDGGVLFVGQGGTGKSTSAFACLNSRLHYLSDDYCLISSDPCPYGHSLYGSGKLDRVSASRFPHLPFRQALGPAAEKALFFLDELYPSRLARGFPIRAILLPEVTKERHTAIEPVSQMAALRAVAPSTIFQLPGAGDRLLKDITAFVRKLPCYRLSIGSDIAEIPDAILNLLSTL